MAGNERMTAEEATDVYLAAGGNGRVNADRLEAALLAVAAEAERRLLARLAAAVPVEEGG